MAWYTPWKRWQRIKITVPSGTTEAQSYFPVYLSAAELPTELTNNTYGRSDGGDMAFAADLGVGDVLASIGEQVPCEVVSASFGVSPSAEIHVRIPTLAATGTLSYLWVGYSNADQTAQPAADSTYGSQNVWKEGASQNYAGVWHFGTPTVLSVADSTANGNDGTNYGVTAAAGQVGGAGSFDGTPIETAANIVVSDADSLTVGAQVTLSAWVRWDDLQEGGIVQKYEPGGFEWIMGFFNDGYLYAWVSASGVASGRRVPGPVDLCWHALVYTRSEELNGGHGQLYIDGTPASDSNFAGTISTTTNTPSPLRIGDGRVGLTNTKRLRGCLDDIRISSVARSASWIAAAFSNQSAPGTFLTLSGSPLTSGNRRRRLLICGARR